MLGLAPDGKGPGVGWLRVCASAVIFVIFVIITIEAINTIKAIAAIFSALFAKFNFLFSFQFVGKLGKSFAKIKYAVRTAFKTCAKKENSDEPKAQAVFPVTHPTIIVHYICNREEKHLGLSGEHSVNTSSPSENPHQTTSQRPGRKTVPKP